jgi:hypothetical protein
MDRITYFLNLLDQVLVLSCFLEFLFTRTITLANWINAKSIIFASTDRVLVILDVFKAWLCTSGDRFHNRRQCIVTGVYIDMTVRVNKAYEVNFQIIIRDHFSEKRDSS